MRLLLAAALATTLAAPALAQSFPDAFRGVWDLTLQDCQLGVGMSDGVLTLTADQLQAWESTGELTAVNIVSPTQMTGRFAFSGEGETWTADYGMAVASDGSRLVIARPNFGETTYVRCG